MQLEFQEVSIIGTGSSPDFLQFPKTEGQLFYLSSEELFGRASEKLHGEFVSPIWLDSLAIGPDKRVRVKYFTGFWSYRELQYKRCT